MPSSVNRYVNTSSVSQLVQCLWNSDVWWRHAGSAETFSTQKSPLYSSPHVTPQHVVAVTTVARHHVLKSRGTNRVISEIPNCWTWPLVWPRVTRACFFCSVRRKFFFCPMPPHVLVVFVILPPGHGRSVTDFWGWAAHEARLRCPDDVSGDIGECIARRALKPKLY